MRSKADSPPVLDCGLQRDENRSFQRRFWIAQRWAWALFGAIIILALAGLTGGGGPLSATTASLYTGTIHHPLVTRWTTAEEMAVTFSTNATPHRLTLDQSFADFFQIESVQPEATRSVMSGDGPVLEFEGIAPGKVTLHLRALRPGVARYDITLDGQRTRVTSLILP